MAAQTWDERYRRGEHTADAALEFIVDWLARLPSGQGSRALDLACGSGRHAAALTSRGWRVTAVDKSAAALELVRQLDPGIQTVAADLEAGEFKLESNSWNLICVSFYMQRNLFAAIRAGVAPGGYVAAAFPMLDDRPGVRPMNPDFLMRPGELPSLFEGFEILHDRETDPPAPKRRAAELFGRKRIADNGY